MAFAVPKIEDELGKQAPGFTLPGTDGREHSLAEVAGPNGTLVAFICNHCPYVKASISRLVEDARALSEEGVNVVAISSNDVIAHPEDSFDYMKDFARQHGLPFPYLFDETQEVARAYEAQCTPDFFGLNAEGLVQYRGRLDEGRKEPPPSEATRDLLEAMRFVAKTGKAPEGQIPSMGCSIKWKGA